MSAHNDTAFLRMFLMILGALIAFTVIILIAANMITGVVEEEQGEDPRLRAVILERIKPVGSVNVAGMAIAAAPAESGPMSGADVVAASCNSCHSIGLLGAPKIGDEAAWSQRLAAEGGLDGLTASAIKGKNAMPPKGGAMVSDAEIRAAIEHMLAQAGVDGGAPAAPAAPAEPVTQASTAEAAAAPAPAPDAAPAAAEAPAADSGADLAKGKAVYGGSCFVCHATGAAGAPKLGDKALWAPRIAQGMAVLETSALNGKGAMPPKGGRMDISDEDVKAAIAYMVSESQ